MHARLPVDFRVAGMAGRPSKQTKPRGAATQSEVAALVAPRRIRDRHLARRADCNDILTRFSLWRVASLGCESPGIPWSVAHTNSR